MSPSLAPGIYGDTSSNNSDVAYYYMRQEHVCLSTGVGTLYKAELFVVWEKEVNCHVNAHTESNLI